MSKKILIVEDEASSRKVTYEKFTREGFEVIMAVNGEEGLKTAYAIHPDLIIMDIIMPVMDGLTMFQKLRESDGQWGKTVPVVVLTNITIENKTQMENLTKLNPECFLVKTENTLSETVEKVKEILEVVD